MTRFISHSKCRTRLTLERLEARQLLTMDLLHSIHNPDPDEDDVFGRSVAISDNTVVVGAYLDDTGADNAGSAYIFDAISGNLLQTLHNPDPNGGNYFGARVASSGSTVVVNAGRDDAGATDAGSVYIFSSGPGQPGVDSIEINTDMVNPPDLPSSAAPTNWQTQRTDVRSITLEFNQPLTISPSDLVLTNLGINAPVDPDTPWLFDTFPTQTSATLNLEFASQVLADGVYSLEILPTATGGDPLFVEFHQLYVDWNGDGGVSIYDFNTFVYWFAKPVGVAPEYVDLNLDGGVSIFDFPAFSNNFDVSVTYPTALVSQNFAVAPLLLPAPAEPNQRHDKPARLEHPLDRQLAAAAIPIVVERRMSSGEAKTLRSETELNLEDLLLETKLLHSEELLDQIGDHVGRGWMSR